MNTEALVELIARRVMEQLRALSGQPVINNPKPSVLVVGDCQDRQQLEQTLGNGYQLTFTSDQQENTAINPDEFDHIVLATLPNSLLSALVIGLERGSEGCLIVESLLLGKTVYILEEGIAYRRYRQTANTVFYQVFADKEATLCSFGMRVVNLVQLTTVFSGVETTKNAYQNIDSQSTSCTNLPTGKDVHIIANRVVGEKDLRACYEQGYRTIKLQERAVITPLARDFLRLREDLVVES